MLGRAARAVKKLLGARPLVEQRHNWREDLLPRGARSATRIAALRPAAALVALHAADAAARRRGRGLGGDGLTGPQRKGGMARGQERMNSSRRGREAEARAPTPYGCWNEAGRRRAANSRQPRRPSPRPRGRGSRPKTNAGAKQRQRDRATAKKREAENDVAKLQDAATNGSAREKRAATRALPAARKAVDEAHAAHPNVRDKAREKVRRAELRDAAGAAAAVLCVQAAAPRIARRARAARGSCSTRPARRRERPPRKRLLRRDHDPRSTGDAPRPRRGSRCSRRASGARDDNSEAGRMLFFAARLPAG